MSKDKETDMKPVAKNKSLVLPVDARKQSRIEKQALTTLDEARAIKVKNTATYNNAAEFALNIKAVEDSVHEIYDEHTQKAYDLHRGLTSARLALLKPLTEARTLITREMSRYDGEQRQLAQQKADEEARKVREAEIAAAKKKRDTETVKELKAAPIVAEPAPVPTPKVQGVQTRTVWKYRFTDTSLIPREYLVPDETKIAAFVKANQDRGSISGIEVYSEVQTILKG